MNIQWEISVSDIEQVIELINQYLQKGGSGLDNEGLERALNAFQEADRIEIVSEVTGG